MRRATLTAAAALLAAIATAAPAPVANQLWVTNKINEVTGTNTAAKIAAATNATLTAANAYTDAAIQGVGGLTPQTVTNIVEGVVRNDIGGGAWVTNITATSGGKDVMLLNVKWDDVEGIEQWLMNLRVPGIGDQWRSAAAPNNTDPNAKTLAASEYPELVTTRGMNALGLAYWTDTTNAIANATPDLSSRTTFDEATNAAAAVVVRDVPAWARSETPPESMTDNAVVLTNSALKTKGGTAISAANVGAIDTNKLNTGMYWKSGSANWMYGTLTVGNGATLQMYNTAKVWFINPDQVRVGAGLTWASTPTLLSWMNTNESDPTVPAWAKAANPPTTTETDPTVPEWAKAATPPESMTDNAAVLTNGALQTKGGTAITAAHVSGAQTAANVQTAIANAGHLTQTAADEAYYPKAQGQEWSTYWDGDDVRVTVTNYDSAANLPSLYLEQRTNETAQATNAFKTVWREMAHWEQFLGTNWNWRTAWGGFQTWKTEVAAELDEKADRAWGYYNSHTGTYSPDNYTQISSSNIMIAAGMSYQKTVTTSAEVWVLTANEPYEPTGISTNGGFQIRDGDGNIQFEIVKGDKVPAAAQANAVTVDQTTTPNTLVVTYNIIAATNPTAEVCLDLSTANWKAETAADCPATVTWSGSSGAYVARIQPNAATTKCFCKATYQRGGDTYINNRCAVGMSQLVLGGVTYNLGTATIDGNTVLTLTPAN